MKSTNRKAMSNDNSQRNNNSFAILTVAWIVGFIAGMIWYNLFTQTGNFRATHLYSELVESAYQIEIVLGATQSGHYTGSIPQDWKI